MKNFLRARGQLLKAESPCILVFVFNLEFAYFQKLFGLILVTKDCLKFLRSCLVNDLKLFLALVKSAYSHANDEFEGIYATTGVLHSLGVIPLLSYKCSSW